MATLSVDWNLLSPYRVPDAIQASVESQLAVLWRFLDCSRLLKALRWKGQCRSEEFEMSLDQWTFTYQIASQNAATLGTIAYTGMDSTAFMYGGPFQELGSSVESLLARVLVAVAPRSTTAISRAHSFASLSVVSTSTSYANPAIRRSLAGVLY